jgi:hypothetical protein
VSISIDKKPTEAQLAFLIPERDFLQDNIRWMWMAPALAYGLQLGNRRGYNQAQENTGRRIFSTWRQHHPS